MELFAKRFCSFVTSQLYLTVKECNAEQEGPHLLFSANMKDVA